MILYDDNFDYSRELGELWNKKLRSVRITGFVVSALMIVCGVLCILFPAQSINVVELIAAAVILVLGVYQIVDYTAAPVFLRHPGLLVSGVLNVFIGIDLLASPQQELNAVFTFALGIVLLVAGIDKLGYSGKLRFFAVADYGWVTLDGILDIAAAVALMIVPLYSAVVINYVLAAYLLVGGVTALIESFSIRDMKA